MYVHTEERTHLQEGSHPLQEDHLQDEERNFRRNQTCQSLIADFEEINEETVRK